MASYRRARKSARDLDAKDNAAVRKYEEAQVKAPKGAVEAEGLFREAIAVWEELLPLATAMSWRL
jgi:hypothetical protein